MFPKIAYCGQRFDTSKFKPVHNTWNEYKPSGGFWASPYIEDGSKTFWADFCEGWAPARVKDSYDVFPKDGIKVWTFDTVKDLDVLRNEYKLDWTRVAQDYDAVYVTRNGVSLLRDGCWDVPTVLFTNLESFDVA